MENNLDMLLVNGNLIDGTGSEPVKNACIAIKDGKISEIFRNENIQTGISKSNTIDLKGATVLPGFINTHVHIDFSDIENTKKWLNSGVTTVRDMGILNGADIKASLKKREVMNRSKDFPRLIMPGKFLTAPGGYGGLDPIGISSTEEAAQRVDELVDSGCDFIKTVLEDGFDPSTFGLPKLSPELLSAICSAAHAKGAWVSAHVSQAKNLEILVDAGINEAAHNVYDRISDELIKKMIDNDVWMITTMNLYKSFSDKFGAPFYETCVDNLLRFKQAGGKIVIGTDFIIEELPWFELGMPVFELQLLADAGLGRMDIIVAATKNAAKVIGKDKSLGTIEKGKIADIIVVQDNPLDDLTNLGNITMVIKDGNIINKFK